MYSGKSTELGRCIRRLKAARKGWLLVTYSGDARYFGDDAVMGTHDKECFPALKVSRLSEVSDEAVLAADTVVVDEGQFFPDLDPVTWRWFNVLRRNVVVGALNSDFKREPFETVSPLYAKATQLQLLSACCARCGQDAPYTKRLNAEQNSTLVMVGGTETYEARCASCFDL